MTANTRTDTTGTAPCHKADASPGPGTDVAVVADTSLTTDAGKTERKPAGSPQADQTRAMVQKLTPRWMFLDGTMIKWVAIATMFIDHVAASLILTHLSTGAVYASDFPWYAFYLGCRRIGRVAFPLFCFALSEGFYHTHKRSRYALRLFLFALISEVPFDLALNNGDIDFLHGTNVIFTLLLALLGLWAAESLSNLIMGAWEKRHPHMADTPASIRGTTAPQQRRSLLETDDSRTALLDTVLTLLFLVLAGMAADLLDCDYGSFGVYLVGILYLVRSQPVLRVLLPGALIVFYCLANSNWIEIHAIFGLLLLLLYNGRRGRGMKYFFYLFYPGHLLLLALLLRLLFPFV